MQRLKNAVCSILAMAIICAMVVLFMITAAGGDLHSGRRDLSTLDCISMSDEYGR
ncbi:hypothetical protein [uncultured Desulfosarcina sp.]|uniref:hypothetical protein n=1 Tax=uncultured Desulfosarcina sp. TaxID=218289 RepID=UPI0029C95E99|nr:hypothetical protein [uncultured Desulfosarcina sp.]